MSDTPDLPPPPGPPTQPPPPGSPAPPGAGGTPTAPTPSWRDDLGVAGDGPSGVDPATGDDLGTDASPATDPVHGDDPDGRGGDGVGRTGLVIALAVGLLVVLGLVAVVVSREPAQLGLDTPEGTVQAWLQSVVDDEPRTDLLDAASTCTRQDDIGYVADDIRARVVDTTIDGDRATVELTITEGTSSGPLDTPYSHEESIELRRDADAWLITGYEWPYDGCWNDERGG